MPLQPHVAIVLLNYNGQSFLERNIPFLLQTSYTNKRIFVIDNASTDHSVSFVKQKYPAITLIELDKNYGYAGGYNHGLKNVVADYFILLNTDVEVTPGFIEPLIDILENNPEACICQPKILSLEHRDQFEYAGAGGGFMDRYGYTFARGRIFNHSEKDEGQYEQDVELFWASGTCFVIKASVFTQLRGFYDYYFMYAEEVDLCWRAQLAGKRILYCHTSVIYHRETSDFIKQPANRVYYVFRNNLIMLLRNLSTKDKMIIIPARILLNTVASFHFLLKGHFIKSLLIIKSLFAVLKWLFRIKKEKTENRKALKKFRTIYKKSVLVSYYLHKAKKFSDLDQNYF